MRRLLKYGGVVLAALLLLLAGLFAFLQTPSGRHLLLAQLQAATEDGPIILQAGSIGGTIPFDMTVEDIALSDAKGIWLTIDRATLDWSPASLLARRLEIAKLHLGNVDMRRAPEKPTDETVVDDESAGPTLPSLPIGIAVQSLAVNRLRLDAPVLGEAAAFTVEASATLGDVDDGLGAKFALRRLDDGDDRIDADIAYRPGADALKLVLAVREPRGGLLARALGLTGAPDLQIDANGDGPLSSWQGNVAATLDRAKLLDLALQVKGDRRKRNIAFTLDADPRPLLAEHVRMLLSGGIKAEGEIMFDEPAGLLHVGAFKAEAASVSLSANGSVGLDAPGRLSFNIHAGDSTPYADFLPGVGWRQAELQGEMHGEIAAPRVAATGTVADLAVGGQRIGFTDISLMLDPQGSLAAGIDFDTFISAGDIALDNPAWRPLLADGARLGAQGRFDLTGKADIQNIDLRTGPLTLFGTVRTEGWGVQSLRAEIDAKLTDLGRWMGSAQPGIKGDLGLSMRADRDAEGTRVDLSGAGKGLFLGIAAIDGLLGANPTLSIHATQDAAGSITLSEAAIEGRSASLTASGRAEESQLDMILQAVLHDLSALDPAVTGAAALRAKISGTQAAPRIAAALTSGEIVFGKYAARAVAFDFDGRDLLTAPRVDVAGKATVDGLPFRLSAKASRQPQTGLIAIRGARLDFGRNTLGGEADVAGGLVAGNLVLDMPVLAELRHLTGIELDGAIAADIGVSHAGGKQNAALSIKSRDLAYAGVANMRDGDITAQLNDLLGKMVIDGRADLRGVAAGGRRLDSIGLTAKGAADGLAVAGQVTGPEISLDLAGNLASEAETMTAELSRFAATYREETVTLARPALLTRQGATMRIADLDLRARGGRMMLDAAISPGGNDIKLIVAEFPLGLLKLVDPTLDAVGTVDATLDMSGPRADPAAQFSLAGKEMGLRGQRGLAADLNLNGNWRRARIETAGRLDFSAGGGLDLSAAFGLPADAATGFPAVTATAALQADAKGVLDLAILDIILAGTADHVSGKADVALQADGTLESPNLSGSVRLSDGRYDNVRYGIRLRRLAAELRGNGQRVDLTSLSAATPGSGGITGNGRVGLGGTMPVAVTLGLDKAQVLNMPDAFAVADATLAIGGDLAQKVTLTGGIKLLKAEIRIPDNLPPTVQEIETIEVNVPPARAAQIEAANKPAPRTLGIALDIAVAVPQQMAIRGRGLDAELGGDLKITGTADQPIVDGVMKMRRGTLDLVGRRLSFSRGQVIFDGAPQIDPVLDFTANARAEGYDVAIGVSGHVSRVRIGLSSTPPLPEDEILSRLLFGKASGSLSALEAIQLAQATAELAGVGGGTDLLDRIRKETGLDRLSVDAGDGTVGPSLGAGRYVGEGVYVGVKQGAAGNSSAATVEMEVTPNVKVEGEVGTSSTGKAGVYWEWDY
ncbi:translocation/assembly module TamB domain-containing protein [Dongia sp.]|uniref:translocation/assembly module TamB domain-containing protein n=1 Tax=Dongia sp. TaxID=1977262 RepID=UPI0035B47D1B